MPIISTKQPLSAGGFVEPIKPNLCGGKVGAIECLPADVLLGQAAEMRPPHPYCGLSWDAQVADTADHAGTCPQSDTPVHLFQGHDASPPLPEEENDCPSKLANPAPAQAEAIASTTTYKDRHLYSFVVFLHRYGALIHLLLKSARQSRYITNRPDIRYIALYLLQCYTHRFSEMRGARSQAVIVATSLFLAAKFCDQNAHIRQVLTETGLASSTVHSADVYECEWNMLASCRYHIQVPRYWQAACEVALAAPHPTMGGDSLSPLTRRRVQHTALYMDRQILELTRNPNLQQAVLLMNADELAFGCSVAVAATMATHTEAVVTLFNSVVVSSLNINIQSLQADALHEYGSCLAHLADLMAKEVSTRGK